jgi:N-acetyl sugar amidotransferase
MINYRICNRCVMDTSVSDIIFDSKGICNYCKDAERKLNNDLFYAPGKADKLMELIQKIKEEGKDKAFDCIIGVSGGVDSSYVAYLVKKVFGLKPLAVHFDNGWNTELAVMNIELLLKKLDIDLYTHVVDWEEFKDLQLAFLKASVANCEIPTDHAIVALLYRIAAKQGVKYILHGGNLASESIMPSNWMHDSKDLIFLKAINKQLGSLPLKTFPKLGYLRIAWYTFIRQIRYVGILNYIDYNKQKTIEFLETEFGWRKYDGKHFESIYTRFFQGFLLPSKFEIDKRRPHFSGLIISGQMSREDALTKLAEAPYSSEKAAEDVNYIKQKFHLTDQEFNNILKAPIKKTSDYPNSVLIIRKFSFIFAFVKRIATGRNK